MSLLRHDNVLFYHPLDSDTEYIQSFDWTRSANAIFDTGVIVSGLTQSSDLTIDIKGVVASGYDNLENYDHFAIAFWSSGLYGGTIKDDTIEIGFGATSVDDGNGVRYSMSEVAGNPRVRLIQRGGTGPLKVVPIFPSTEGWHLTIVDFSLQETIWRYSVSINGSGWQIIGSGGAGVLPDADINCIIDLALESTSNNIILDEIVVWAGHDIFTNDELANLYELINTYDQSMNQYTSIFGTPINSGIDLSIHGHTDTSGDTSLYIPSQKEIKSTYLFINGSMQISGNIDLYVSGTPPIASSLMNLYTIAPTPTSDNINLYAIGPLLASDNIDNFTQGYQTSSNDIGQHIHGYLITFGNVDLYISGIPAISSSVDLYIVGPILINDNISDFIWGHLPASDNANLYIKGLFPTFDAFISVVDNNPSDSLNLFTHGVPSGESTTFYTNDTITLFINDSGDDNTVDSSWSAFTKVADAILIPSSGTWQSFVKVGNAINSNINLYINSHASGEIPHGTLTSDLITTFIDGQATQNDDEGLLSDGYFVVNTEIFAFTKVHLGLDNILNFYVSGEILITPPSAILDLFTFGISGTIYDSCTLYISSKKSINDTYDLFVFGIQDTKSGNQPLYLEVTNIGLFNQECNLYSHGF